MKKLLLAALAVTCLPLSACVSTEFQNARADAWTEYRNTIPVCSSDAECKAMWEMAEVWVVRNADYKIQSKTDIQISTFNSNDSGIQVNVLKEPIGGGKYQIVATVMCGALAAEFCTKHPAFLSVDFNKTLNALKTPEKRPGTAL